MMIPFNLSASSGPLKCSFRGCFRDTKTYTYVVVILLRHQQPWALCKAVGKSFRNLDIPVECRGSGTVFTDAELMVTAQFFSEMMSAYAAKAVTKGKGVPLKNTTFNSDAPDLAFVSSVDFVSNLEAACTDLRFSEANLSSLRKMGDVGDQIFNELSELLASHTSWNRALQASIDSYLAFERPQTETVNRKLFLRCYRSLFFMMFRALASDCDPSVFQKISDVFGFT